MKIIIANTHDFDVHFLNLLSENLLHDNRLINKLIDKLNFEQEEIKKMKGSEEK